MDETDKAQIAMGRKPVLRSEIATAVDASQALEWRVDDMAQQMFHVGRTLLFEDTRAVAAVDAEDAAAFGQLMAAGLVLALSGSASALTQQNSSFPDPPTSAFFANTCRQMKHFYNPFRLDSLLVSEGMKFGRMVLGPLPLAVETVLGPVEAARAPSAVHSLQMISGSTDRRGQLRGEWVIPVSAATPVEVPAGPASLTTNVSDHLPRFSDGEEEETTVLPVPPGACIARLERSTTELLTRAINVKHAIVVGPDGKSTQPFAHLNPRPLAMRPQLLEEFEIRAGLRAQTTAPATEGDA
jgi:hypothetical protein